MSLRVFNTSTGQKEEFIPLREGRVGMYVCGVTVYDYCHVGHARAAIVFDTVYRYLQHLGYEVNYVCNFTDIDDKIIKRANEENIGWQEVTEKYIQAFYEDMGQLNITPPTTEPKATDHIDGMLDMVSSLIEQGKAYEAEGDVYFSVRNFAEYGKLSGHRLDDLKAGARVEPGEHKRDPLDFALWKKSKPGEPSWDSPWGPGRPGWHIECSAMSRHFLGTQFDIHGGGKDLVFPHHENEIAQSQGCSGTPPVKYWLHNGFVNINEEKMSKSLGNFFTIREILKRYHPEVLRLFLLSHHYRGPIDFADSYLNDAEKTLDRFYEFFAAVQEIRGDLNIEEGRSQPFIRKIEEAMNDDFNTAVTLAHMKEELRNLNKAMTDLNKQNGDWAGFDKAAAALKYACRLLGFLYHEPKDYKARVLATKKETMGLDVSQIEALIEQRKAAREAKDWAKADECRDALTALGVVLEDTAQGTVWKVK
ncbi:MAG: cysteine--tRNA ligase [Nitrospinae bacterium]|nr:cysteine--tRNA ligase [Nitrospinota bacterium]